MTRRIEIEASAWNGLTAMHLATVEMSVPDDASAAMLDELSQVTARMLAIAWNIDASEVRVSAYLVEQSRRVLYGGDVKVRPVTWDEDNKARRVRTSRKDRT